MSAHGVTARWLDDLVDRRVDLRAIALMRVLLGVVVIRHLWPDARAAVTPVERFFVPWWSWLPVPSPGLYRVLVWLGVAAGVGMVLGVAVRVATATAFLVVSYLLFVDMTGFAHNRGFLVWLLFGLSLMPTDGVFTILRRSSRDHAGRPTPLPGPWWPLLMLRIVVSSVYLTSGTTKLFNPDWRTGQVLWDRMVRGEHLIPFDGSIHDLLISRGFHYALSPTAIVIELFVGVGLWFGRTRLAAIWVAFVFHLTIELTASVQTFSYSAIAALLLWATPAAGDRTFSSTGALATTVRRLDWLGRFTLPEPPACSGTTLLDRDGVTRHGTDAALTALSRLPILFPLMAPPLVVRRIRQRTRAVR